MKKLLILLSFLLPLSSQAETAQSAGNMLAQLPAFLVKLDTLRGKALTVAEKAAVTNVVTQGNTVVNNTQTTFINTIAKATKLDTATLGLLFPNATQKVSNADLTSKLEGKTGKKLDFVQKASVTAANTLRNNSLDSMKTNLSTGVASKLNMDPALVSSLLPLLGL